MAGAAVWERAGGGKLNAHAKRSQESLLFSSLPLARATPFHPLLTITVTKYFHLFPPFSPQSTGILTRTVLGSVSLLLAIACAVAARSHSRRCSMSSSRAMDVMIVARCSYDREIHVINFDGNSSLLHLLDQVRDRWPEVDPVDTILKYHTPVKDSELVILRNDNDVRNMYRWHIASGVTHGRIVVEGKRPQFMGHPAPQPPQPQPQPQPSQPQPPPVEIHARYYTPLVTLLYSIIVLRYSSCSVILYVWFSYTQHIVLLYTNCSIILLL